MSAWTELLLARAKTWAALQRERPTSPMPPYEIVADLAVALNAAEARAVTAETALAATRPLFAAYDEWLLMADADCDDDEYQAAAQVVGSEIRKLRALFDVPDQPNPTEPTEDCTCEDVESGRGFEGCPTHDELTPIRLRALTADDETADSEWDDEPTEDNR